MMRLIRFEFIKQFCKRSTLVILVLFSIINLLKIHSEYKAYSYLSNGNDERSWNAVYWHLYDEYSGEITVEKINHLLDLYSPLAEATADMTASTATDNPNTMTGNLYSDRNLLDKYYVQPMQYFYGYQSAADRIAEKARENSLLYEERGEEYEARKNVVIYRLYADRAISEYAYHEMYNYYLNYDFSTVLMLLLCLYGIVSTFVSEKETQMDMLLLTSVNGGKKTALAKIVAVTVFVWLVCLWFSLLDYIGFAASFHTFEGWSLPAYAIPNLAEAAVNINLLQYSLLSAALKAVGAWTLGMLMLLLSTFWKNALIPFVLDLATCMALIIGGASVAYSSFPWAKVLNPYSLLTNRILMGKTEFLNIANHPVLTYKVAVAFALISSLLIALAIYFLSAENRHCCVRRAK